MRITLDAPLSYSALAAGGLEVVLKVVVGNLFAEADACRGGEAVAEALSDACVGDVLEQVLGRVEVLAGGEGGAAAGAPGTSMLMSCLEDGSEHLGDGRERTRVRVV